MSDELAEMRAEIAALKAQLAANNPMNDHLNRVAADARREAGNEAALKANRDAAVFGVSDSARTAAQILMDHDPAFWKLAQQAKKND